MGFFELKLSERHFRGIHSNDINGINRIDIKNFAGYNKSGGKPCREPF